MPMSRYLSLAMRNLALGQVSFDPPDTVYVALYTADPTATGSANSNEYSGSNYSRASVTNNTTEFPTVSGADAKTNANAITFPIPSANWESLTHWAIVDTASGAGNILVYGALTNAPVTVPSGADPVRFAAGELDIT